MSVRAIITGSRRRAWGYADRWQVVRRRQPSCSHLSVGECPALLKFVKKYGAVVCYSREPAASARGFDGVHRSFG